MKSFRCILTAIFAVISFASFVSADIVINETDADTASYDELEFIELYDGGTGYTALDGLVVVLFNGSSDTSYLAIDLDGYTTDNNGYFVIGSVSGADIWMDPGSGGWLQNGADAIVLYTANDTDFPNGTSITTTNLVDAIVYDTSDPDDSGLLVLLNAGQPQVNEGGAGDKDSHSNQRCANGSGGSRNTDTYIQDSPTPAADNNCPTVLSSLVINEIHADPDNTDGDANMDGIVHYSDDEFVEIVNSSDSDIDISGWTLSDSNSVRHIFNSGTIIAANCAIIIFGGGSPMGDFGGVIVQTASTGSLGLNNSGDTITLNNGTSDQAIAVYGSEGGDNQSLTLDPDVTGGSYEKHSLASGSGGTLFSTGRRIDGTMFSGCTIVSDMCGDPATYIHNIQGSGSSSPELNNIHSVEGVVVGDFQDTTNQLSGFYLQEEDKDVDMNPATSEGIFIFDNGMLDVNVGDIVRVRGTVVEFYGLTELRTLTNIRVCGTGSVTPVTVSLPVSSIDEWETYEGMLITIPQTLYVSGNYYQGRWGEVILSAEDRLYNPTNVVAPGDPANALQKANDLKRIQLEDGSLVENPMPLPPYIGADNTLRAGDTTSQVTGILSYGYGEYEIHPTRPVSFTRQNYRESAPEDVGGRLKVASFNVLNYFNGDGLGGGFPTPRGAYTLEEFERQRDKIIFAIVTMDADIIGLMEIENDETPNSAIEDLVSGLNAATSAGTYDFIDTGLVGTDEIRTAFIYKPGLISPVGSFAILDSSVDPTFIDTKNRPVLAQSFAENSTGRMLTVAVNHLKSKGTDCDDLGDPDMGDGQGNCNLTRTSAATALVNWLASDPTGVGDKDYLIIGDLNAYAMEDPISAITSAGYIDIIGGGYSYVYDGQAGYLDHALASTNLVSQVTGVTHWHINADEPSALDYNDHNQPALYTADAYRSSDHDPVIIGLDLAPAAQICSNLGNNKLPFMPDWDVFKINGLAGHNITISLEAVPAQDGHGKKASLAIRDNIHHVRFFKKDFSQLPVTIQATLPADGVYSIFVEEVVRGPKNKRFKGDYCLSLDTDPQIARSLEPTKWIE